MGLLCNDAHPVLGWEALKVMVGGWCKLLILASQRFVSMICVGDGGERETRGGGGKPTLF
jgi:hypothetical protein